MDDILSRELLELSNSNNIIEFYNYIESTFNIDSKSRIELNSSLFMNLDNNNRTIFIKSFLMYFLYIYNSNKRKPGIYFDFMTDSSSLKKIDIVMKVLKESFSDDVLQIMLDHIDLFFFNDIKGLSEYDFRKIYVECIKDSKLKNDLRLKYQFKGDLKLEYFYLNINHSNSLIEMINIDPSITFGVELEVCHDKLIHKIIKFDNKEFMLDYDCSVSPGNFEFVSPILRYNKEDLIKLRDMCNTLEQNNFYTNYTCGGHIHIGSNYFNKESFLIFLTIYLNCESIIYKILNRENSFVRTDCNMYAKSISKNYISFLEKVKCNNYTLEQIFELSKNILNYSEYSKDSSRYHGLNFTNIGDINKQTIEFRCPNGEINYNELKLNIEFVLRLVEYSKKILNDRTKLKLLERLEFCSEEEKFNILMLLLDLDKNKYINRFNNNQLGTIYITSINVPNLIKIKNNKVIILNKEEDKGLIL